MQTYPTIKTGTSQDLMSIVARAYERQLRREGGVLPRKTAVQRAFLEAPFNVLGAAIHAVASCLPAEWVMRFHDRLFSSLSSPRHYAFDARSESLLKARRLVEEVEKRSGRSAALVGVISHPPVSGDMAHMNFELVRHAMLGLRALRGGPCRPRLVVAVDLFALDTISIPAEGLYAGYMGLYHVGLDRLVLGRGALSARLIAKTAWHRTAHRLLRELGRGAEVGIAIAGGVPSTARVLYGAREWMQEQRRRSPWRAHPGEVLRRLRLNPDYLRFEREGPCGEGLSRNAWRMLEAWIMAGVAAEGCGPSSAEQGLLLPEAERRARDCLEALDVPSRERALALEKLAAVVRRETPPRSRFFRVLAGRVLRRRPVVFLPIVHRGGFSPGVDIREAWSWRSGGPGGLEGSSPRGSWSGTAEAFAEDFIRENFS